MKTYRLLSAIAYAFLIAACGDGGNPPADSAVAYAYSIPAQTNDGWATGHLHDQAIDSTLIMKMMDGINAGLFTGINSVTIVRNNTLVLNATFQRNLDRFDSWVGNNDPERHVLQSTSKSFTSALIGIAIDQQYITSVDVPFYDLFPYANYANPDPRKSTMTLKDALTMRLGFGWDEWTIPYGTAGNDLQDLMEKSTDFAKALLDLPLESDPGTAFTYNTAATIAIGQALQNSVGTSMVDFAETHLFQPLQIQTAEWGRTPTGLPNGGGGLILEPRDMIKLGQLFINGGMWNGQKIISAAWVDASVQPHVDLNYQLSNGYGYQWWLGGFTYQDQAIEVWSTRGYGGQDIFCIPSLGFVVAFTGQNYGSGQFLPFELMQDYILPSVN